MANKDNWAAEAATIKALAAAGANVNTARNDGRTALHSASYRGHAAVASALLAAGAAVDAPDLTTDSGTSLIIVCTEFHMVPESEAARVATVQALLAGGAARGRRQRPECAVLGDPGRNRGGDGADLSKPQSTIFAEHFSRAPSAPGTCPG